MKFGNFLARGHFTLLIFYRLSVSADLRYDAERDLRDIGARNIQVSTSCSAVFFFRVCCGFEV